MVRPGERTLWTEYPYATFRVPLPPSANHAYRNVPGKGRVKTDTYKAWLLEAAQYLAYKIDGNQGLPEQRPPDRTPWAYRAVFWLPSLHVRDLDNMVKPLQDFMVDEVVGVDDRYVAWHMVYREQAPLTEKRGYVDVTVVTLMERVPSASRERHS